ncbi:MAG: ferredoxin [Clostridiaceae bacterium]|nr:ferredoxin [Clostridiaceae bacterium]
MRACVDKDLCIGCGLCEALSPAVFKMDDEGKAEAITEELSQELQNEAEEAKRQCPVEAISIEK